MEAKEYLKSIRTADTIINEKLKECDQLRGMRYKITQTLKPVMVSGGGSHGGFTDASDRVIDLEREIDREVDRFVDLKREAGALLAQLENPQHYTVLHRHYILFESFEKIAVDMGYTYRNVCYLHGRALQKFGYILNGIDPKQAETERRQRQEAKDRQGMKARQKAVKDEYGEDSPEYHYFLNEYGDWGKDVD